MNHLVVAVLVKDMLGVFNLQTEQCIATSTVLQMLAALLHCTAMSPVVEHMAVYAKVCLCLRNHCLYLVNRMFKRAM